MPRTRKQIVDILNFRIERKRIPMGNGETMLYGVPGYFPGGIVLDINMLPLRMKACNNSGLWEMVFEHEEHEQIEDNLGLIEEFVYGKITELGGEIDGDFRKINKLGVKWSPIVVKLLGLCKLNNFDYLTERFYRIEHVFNNYREMHPAELAPIAE